jgi:hypothetical protein
MKTSLLICSLLFTVSSFAVSEFERGYNAGVATCSSQEEESDTFHKCTHIATLTESSWQRSVLLAKEDAKDLCFKRAQRGEFSSVQCFWKKFDCEER